jgi:hypothetical protein
VYSSPSNAPIEQLLSEWDLLVEVRSFRLDVSGGRPWRDAFKAEDQLVTALIKESMGRVLATERDWKHAGGAGGRSSAAPPLQVIDVPCTVKKSFSLLLGKFSIEDGDVLLSREDPAYIRHVIDEVKKALEREGYAGELGTLSTSHNPFRYWQEQDGRFYIFGPHGSRPSQRELEAFLGRHEFEIWVFDFDGVRRLVDSVEVSVMWS